jgi:predicted DNA-binding transcriptional regulator AlpA
MDTKIENLIEAMQQAHKMWLNPDDLEQEYGISKSTAAKMRMAKILPYHKIGKYVRYHRPDIDQWFQDAKVV